MIIFKFIPNIITIFALSLGLSAIRYAFEKHWKAAIITVMFSAFCDFFDGRIARGMKSESNFGKQLDSLSDLINFGVTPAIIMHYFYSISKSEWIVFKLFIICQAIRLARFNSMKENINYFIGVPAPIGGILLLLPVMIYNAFNIYLSKIFVLIYSVIISFLAVSRIKTPAIKHIDLRQFSFPIIIFFICLISIPWITICVSCILYFITILLINILKRDLH